MKLTVSSFEASGLPGSNNPGLTLGVHFLSSPSSGWVLRDVFPLFNLMLYNVTADFSLSLAPIPPASAFPLGRWPDDLLFQFSEQSDGQSAGYRRGAALSLQSSGAPSTGQGRTPSRGSGHSPPMVRPLLRQQHRPAHFTLPHSLLRNELGCALSKHVSYFKLCSILLVKKDYSEVK